MDLAQLIVQQGKKLVHFWGTYSHSLYLSLGFGGIAHGPSFPYSYIFAIWPYISSICMPKVFLSLCTYMYHVARCAGASVMQFLTFDAQ
jgi:hypothetical protein